jgi:hypothetical protein
MKITPKIPHKMPIIEAAIATGKYQICPDTDPEFPQVSEPMHNPNRNDQVAKWVPEQFSFQMPDGGTFFCELLQSGDPGQAWSTEQPAELTEEDF